MEALEKLALPIFERLRALVASPSDDKTIAKTLASLSCDVSILQRKIELELLSAKVRLNHPLARK